MNRIALVTHTTSYGAAGFVEACRAPAPASCSRRIAATCSTGRGTGPPIRWSSTSAIPMQAAAVIAAANDAAAPISAVLPVGGELPAKVAAAAARRLGLPANAPDAMAAAANKLLMRGAARRRRGSRSASASPGSSPSRAAPIPAQVADRVTAPGGVGFPCVVKPLMLSGSRGVMRADDRLSLAAALARLARLLADPAVRRPDPQAAGQILVESFVAGPEFALEGILTRGALQVLALFDKPDPLDGPTFEETLYVTPSRLSAADQARLAESVAAAARALGLETGPVHAELRWSPATTARAHRDGRAPDRRAVRAQPAL